MEYIYAALLLHSAKKEINEENLKNVLTAAGVNVDEARLKSLIESLKNINIEEVLKSVSTTPISVQPQSQTQETEKKEEKKKEESKASEEQAVAGLAALFGL